MTCADLVTLTVDAMVHGGSAMGRDATGRAVFVDGALPGETVTARLTAVRERYAHAVLAAIPEAPSPERIIEPRCPRFGRWPERGEQPARYCGGCHWGHVDYGAQLRFKTDILRDALVHLGRIAEPTVEAAVGMPDPWEYRNRIDVHSGPDGPGFVAVDDRTILPIDACPVAHPAVVDLLAALEGALPPGVTVSLRTGVDTGDRMIVFHGLEESIDEVDEIEVELDASVTIADGEGHAEVVAGRRFLFERLGGRLFAIPPASFFQVNTTMAEALVASVRDAVPADTGLLVDAYSGVGTFAVLLADRAREVYAIESDAAAVQAGVENAAGLLNVTFLEADGAEGLAWVERRPDVVVVDPPRAGLGIEMVRLLIDREPPTIVYVSCDPATLARDVRQLVAAGWSLAGSRVVDMFPHTYHVESVSVLRR